jgi:hypothetical protein
MIRPKVIDADGHIYENHEEIEEYFEGKYRGMRRARAYVYLNGIKDRPNGSERSPMGACGLRSKRPCCSGAECLSPPEPTPPSSEAGKATKLISSRRCRRCDTQKIRSPARQIV